MNDILFGYALGIMTLPLGIGIFHIYKWLVSAGYISPSKAEKKREELTKELEEISIPLSSP